MGKLLLAFLGAPQVRHDGQALAFRTRKALGLLVYLTVTGGMHSREKLTALFWPDSDEEQGRASLRNTLLYLRNALHETSDTSHLIIERDALGFDFRSTFELDIHTLQTAFRQALTHTSTEGLQREVYRSLLFQFQGAVEQYRGDFLSGFSLDDAPDFDGWMRIQRETWHQRMSTILDRLSRVQFDGGEMADASETTTRWLAHDPLNESVYQRLMQVHFAVGDRNAALSAYEACRSMLAKELHTLPAPETKTLAERIRAKKPLQSAQYVKKAHLATLPGVPLIGRVAEYGGLIEAYHAVAPGQTRVLVLTGEAGIGKTRLAVEFLGWASAHGADVLRGRTFESGGQLPYQALVDALRARVEQENAPEDLLSDTWLAELSLLLPELRDRYPDLPLPTADETTARIRLFESVVRLFQALAEREPVVLFIDDLHWVDIATLDILHYAARRWQESKTPLLLLVSLRAGTLARESALGSWLASLEHDLHPTNLVLGPLTGEDTTRLVRTLAQEDSGSNDVEQVSRWLFDETRGQPFYIMEMLKALLERGLLVPHLEADGNWGIDFKAVATAETALHGMLPPGVRQVIRSRFAKLPPAAFTLLAAGAVLGRAFTFERVCRVAGIEEHEGLLALDELLLSQHLTESTEHERDAYAFTHDKIRDVAYTEAGEARRRIFHRRALDVLEASFAPPAELVRHARAAGLIERAFHLNVAAGDTAMHLFAIRDAIAHYEQARQVLPEQQAQLNLQHPAIKHLYIQLGRAYELNSEFEQAETVYEGLLTFARTSDLPAVECTALNSLATLAFQSRYDVAGATTLLHQALLIAERLGESIELAETAWSLAQLGFYRFAPLSGIPHGERALTIARQLNQQELLARSLNVLSHAHSMAGLWEESERYAAEGQRVSQALKNRAMEADCLAQIATDHINLGRTQAGIDAAQEAYTISLQIDNVWGQVNGLLPVAQGLMELGKYTEALEFAQHAAQLARSHNMFVLMSFALTTLGAIYRAMLALDAAQATHREGLQQYESMGPPLIEMFAAELCSDYALAGAWEEAHACAQRVLESRTDTIVLSTKLNLWYGTEALVRAGELERAIGDVERFGERIGSSRRYRIPYLRALAILDQQSGKIEQALEHLREAAILAEEIGLPGELWMIQAALADLYLLQNETEQAHSAFKQAAIIVQKLADSMGNDEQRANFLTSPLVERVLDS